MGSLSPTKTIGAVVVALFSNLNGSMEMLADRDPGEASRTTRRRVDDGETCVAMRQYIANQRQPTSECIRVRALFTER
jgi:hypothetical protein